MIRIQSELGVFAERWSVWELAWCMLENQVIVSPRLGERQGPYTSHGRTKGHLVSSLRGREVLAQVAIAE